MNDTSKIVISPAFKAMGMGQKLGANIGSSFTWISCKGKVWKLHHEGETHIFTRPDDGTPSPHLDVVILAENPNTSKIFYEGVYSENSANPPDCASIDGKTPDANVPKPQAKYCGDCKWDRFNSAPNGGRGKACQDHKRIAVLLMPNMTKKMMPQALLTPVFLKVPPDSLKPWKAYGESLEARGAPHFAVVTRISFAPDRQFQMAFTLKQALTDKEQPVIKKLIDSQQTLTIIGGGTFDRDNNAAPALPEPEEEETGLLEAFSEAAGKPASLGEGREARTAAETAVKRGRGRPAGSPNKPKLVEAKPPVEDVDEDEEASSGDDDAPGEAGDQLSDRVAELLKSKVSKVLE